MSDTLSLEKLTIYCADIGSVSNNRFGWARIVGNQEYMNNCIVDFVDDIASAIAKGHKVALGFECPLWVPVSTKPQCLTKGRRVDGNRPWSAGAGTAVLATGITQVAWILDRLRSQLNERRAALPAVHLNWSEFVDSESALFFWEAFVTGKAKDSRSEHAKDALIACREFAGRLPDPTEKCNPEPQVRSLIGGAILWAGWSTDLNLLHMPSVVVRP
ncbi:MAG: hypothetical protein F4239_07860 [Gammaproteobacteria bacterium]|nr:hypothetical protein [Gammaproteobacteria bacterium]